MVEALVFAPARALVIDSGSPTYHQVVDIPGGAEVGDIIDIPILKTRAPVVKSRRARMPRSRSCG